MAQRSGTIGFHFIANFRDSGVSTGVFDALLTCKNGLCSGSITRMSFGNLDVYKANLDRINRSLGEKYSDYYNSAHPYEEV